VELWGACHHLIKVERQTNIKVCCKLWSTTWILNDGEQWHGGWNLQGNEKDAKVWGASWYLMNVVVSMHVHSWMTKWWAMMCLGWSHQRVNEAKMAY
jgi:hypothetical protein